SVNNLPTAPVGVTCQSGNSQITLQWSAVPTATSYNVYVASSAIGPFSLESSVVGQPTYTDAPLNNGTTYYYEITAVNSFGEGPASTPINTTPESAANILPTP